jgi:hypothetical protein
VVSLRNVVHVFVGVMEDNGGNSGNAGAHIKSIFEGRVPILALVDTIAVSLSELAERLAGEDSHGELSHGVHGLGEALDQGFDIGRDLTAVEDLSLELLKLTCGGELASEEEPKGSLREGLRATFSLGRLSSNGVKIFASVGDTIHIVKFGCLIEEAGHASHATNNLAYSNFSELSVAVLLLEVAEDLLFFLDGVLHLLLEGGGEVSLSVLYYSNST